MPCYQNPILYALFSISYTLYLLIELELKIVRSNYYFACLICYLMRSDYYPVCFNQFSQLTDYHSIARNIGLWVQSFIMCTLQYCMCSESYIMQTHYIMRSQSYFVRSNYNCVLLASYFICSDCYS